MLKHSFLFMLLMVTVAECQANNCAIINKFPVFSFTGPITVSPSAAIGSAIATGQTQTTITDIAQGGSYNYFDWSNPPVTGVTFSQNGALVAPTNISGIGISVWNDASIPTTSNGLFRIAQPAKGGTNTYTVNYALVKTANVVSSGTLNSVVFSGISSDCSRDPAVPLLITHQRQ